MTIKNKSKTQTIKKSSTTSRYVSFNFDEIARLKETSTPEAQRGKVCLRCWRLYFELKILSDFKTGVVGEFRDQKLSYEGLAQMVTIPVTKGASTEIRHIDGKEVRRLIDVLQAAGLVTNVVNDGQRLTMRLPLSPIKNTSTNNPATAAPAPAQSPVPLLQPQPVTIVEDTVSASIAPIAATAEASDDDWLEKEYGELIDCIVPTGAATTGSRLPTESLAETDVSACFDEQFGLSTEKPSVLTSIHHQYPISILEGSGLCPDPNSARAEGTGVGREVLGAAAMSAEQIRESMRQHCPNALWLDHRDSAILFRQMQELDVERDVLQAAINRLTGDKTKTQTPAALFDELVYQQQAIRRRRANLRSY